MVVTLVEPFHKNKSKVFIDENFAFVLYAGELNKYQIKEQQEISEQIYREIVDTVLYKRARSRLLNLLKRADRTEAELRRKLKDGWYPEAVIERAVAYIDSYHYFDDEKYAVRYIEQNRKSKSKKQLIFDLKKKGVDSALVSVLMETQFTEELEELQILQWLKRKRYDKNLSSGKELQRIISTLIRKGYHYEKIKKVMKETDLD